MIASCIAIISLIAWIGCSLYCLLIVFALLHWMGSKDQKPYGGGPTIPCSILIPFRNEAENLPRLLDSLNSIKMLDSTFEIILIDDHSEDNSVEIIKARQKSNYFLERADGYGKKAAVAQGVSISKFDTIFQLDADCTFKDQWFLSIQNKLNSGIEFLTGIVSIKNPRDLLDHFQLFDLMALMGITNAGITSKIWYMANGANMAYPKKLYHSISNKAHAAHASGEDMFLIEEAARQKIKIAFNPDKAGIVFTQPVQSIKSIIHQRLRWASKNNALHGVTIKWILTLVVLFNIALLILPLLDSFYFLFWFVKILIDFIYLKTISRDFDTKILWQYYLVCSILYPLFISCIGILYLARYPFSWKGR